MLLDGLFGLLFNLFSMLGVFSCYFGFRTHYTHFSESLFVALDDSHTVDSIERLTRTSPTRAIVTLPNLLLQSLGLMVALSNACPILLDHLLNCCHLGLLLSRVRFYLHLGLIDTFHMSFLICLGGVNND